MNHCCFIKLTVLLHFVLSFPKAAVVPSAQTLKITDFGFSDFELSDLETALCTIRMFTDLNLVQNFQMKHEVGIQLCPLERECVCKNELINTLSPNAYLRFLKKNDQS